MEDLKPRKLAVTLSRYVTKTPAGIGLGTQETMEMALRECGTLRILFAAFCSVIGKLFRRKGWFYIVAGPRPGASTAPPRAPSLPMTTTWSSPPPTPWVSPAGGPQALGHPVAIVDINDWGPHPGCSQKEPSMALLARILGTTPWVSPVSAPPWASSAKYDIRARRPGGNPCRAAAFYSLFVLNSLYLS